jgi:hypothetical protein
LIHAAITLITQPIAVSEVITKGNHFMGKGRVLPSFLDSCHLLKSRTLRIMTTTAAARKSTWKNWIMGEENFAREVKVFDAVSSTGKVVSLQDKAP